MMRILLLGAFLVLSLAHRERHVRKIKKKIVWVQSFVLLVNKVCVDPNPSLPPSSSILIVFDQRVFNMSLRKVWITNNIIFFKLKTIFTNLFKTLYIINYGCHLITLKKKMLYNKLQCSQIVESYNISIFQKFFNKRTKKKHHNKFV